MLCCALAGSSDAALGTGAAAAAFWGTEANRAAGRAGTETKGCAGSSGGWRGCGALDMKRSATEGRRR